MSLKKCNIINSKITLKRLIVNSVEKLKTMENTFENKTLLIEASNEVRVEFYKKTYKVFEIRCNYGKFIII